jgi:cytochrome c biogenesis protein CcmG/thiol:disulfide interchange protein DsbE
MRRLLLAAGAVALVAVIVIGLTQASSDGGSTGGDATKFDLPAAKEKLAAAPPPLNGLYTQANQLLGGGTSAFAARMDELKGHPLVISKWASWCGPCQAEFSIFQDVATQRGKDVGFLGLNVTDTDSHARGFLAKRTLPFPSYADPDEKLTAELKAPLKIAPVTVFVGRNGKIATVHSGAYKSTKQLNADIDRYLS